MENNVKVQDDTQSLQSCVMARYCIRSKTNIGDFAKQYFKIIAREKMDTALVISKLILTEDTDEMYFRNRYELLKEFKGKKLYRQVFSIKVGTLIEALSFFNEP